MIKAIIKALGLHFHTYSKWTDRGLVNIVYGGSIIGQVMSQERYCSECNKVQYRRAKI